MHACAHADVEKFIQAAEAEGEELEDSLEMSATYLPLVQQSHTSRCSPPAEAVHSVLSSAMLPSSFWQAGHALLGVCYLSLPPVGLLPCGMQCSDAVLYSVPATGNQDALIVYMSVLEQVVEAKKAVSTSMTAEGMRQQNEALRWALRASSLGGSPGCAEAGDESTLLTGSDESAARSVCNTSGTHKLHCPFLCSPRGA